MGFRFLVDGALEGATNMAVDEALYLTALEDGLPTLRLYGFGPPAVSFGYRQRLEEAISPGACRDLGIAWVRRPTGGRALLHQHELTYALASRSEGVFQGLSVRGVYRAVNGAIRRALAELGIPLDPEPAGEDRALEPPSDVPCLAAPSRHEIASGGRKIVASAQKRSARAFLQHGSILRRVDRDLWERLAPGPGRPEPLRAVGLDEISTVSIPGAALESALRASFEELLGVRSVRKGLGPAERARVSGLERKYLSDDWNARGELRGGDFPSFSRSVDNSEAVW